MKIDFDRYLLDPEGNCIPTAPGSDENMSLKDPCMSALLTQMQGDSETPGQGYRLYTIAHQVKAGGEVDLPSADVALIKTRIERIFPPWIIGQTWDLLEGKG